MKAQIIYVKGNAGSESQANFSLKSFMNYNHDVFMQTGITPDTLKQYDNYKVLTGSRLESFLTNDNNVRKYNVKKSCVLNNVEFAKKVIESDEPMLFIEHDAECVSSLDNFDFDEFCYLGIETWNKPPSGLAIQQFRNYNPLYKIGTHDFPNDWPLKYHKDTLYKGAKLTPGTMAYALSPKGAKKLLHAVETYGLEQSDFLINSNVLRLQYVYPAVVKHQPENLNLSHRL